MTEQFELIGNEPWLWKRSADSLAYCAGILKQHRDQEQGLRETDPGSTLVELMLWGYTLECLLKCLLLQNDHRLVRGGKLNNKYKHHNLVKYAREAGFSLCDSQQDILERLSLIIRWGGRYPTAATAEGNLPRYWETPKDDEALGSLIECLTQQIDVLLRGIK